MISICLCIGYSLFGSSSLSTKGKRRFYICVSVQRKIAVWVAKKPDIFGLFAGDIFFVSTLWRRWFIRSARFRARRHAHGRRNSHRLFLCFATAFSNLSAYTNKKSRRQKSRRDFWRRWRDSNSRGGYPPYALSRGASSPA